MRVRPNTLLLTLALVSSLFALCPSWAQQAKEAPKKPAAPAAQEEEKLPDVLPPEQFFGVAAMGYGAAKAVPKVCAKVFCYCGCDITDHHKCLLDCFASMHGVDCHICQEEAMQALRMDRNDDSIAAIQQAIDEGYSSKYPFKEESPALKHYKSVRLWHPTVAGTPAAKGEGGDTCCAQGKHEEACCPK